MALREIVSLTDAAWERFLQLQTSFAHLTPPRPVDTFRLKSTNRPEYEVGVGFIDAVVLAFDTGEDSPLQSYGISPENS